MPCNACARRAVPAGGAVTCCCLLLQVVAMSAGPPLLLCCAAPQQAAPLTASILIMPRSCTIALRRAYAPGVHPKGLCSGACARRVYLAPGRPVHLNASEQGRHVVRWRAHKSSGRAACCVACLLRLLRRLT